MCKLFVLNKDINIIVSNPLARLSLGHSNVLICCAIYIYKFFIYDFKILNYQTIF